MVKRKILLVAANPAVSTTLGWPVGFWASELTHPWYEFREAGYEMTIASPEGGRIVRDPMSDPRDASGHSAHDILSRGFFETPSCAALLESTQAVGGIAPAEFDALLFCGGQAPMFTFRGDTRLQGLARAFHEAGKPVAALCHGVAALIDVQLGDGFYLIAGKTMTGFANAEEDMADAMVGQRIMPWRIEDAARERGANYVMAGAWRPCAVRDGLLITGQQQNSGAKTARLVIEALGV